MPLFNVAQPANAEAMFKILLYIAAFDMVPSELVYKDMLEALKNESRHDELTGKVESLGFESTWLIPNLGSILFFVGLFVLVLLVLLLFSKVPCCCYKTTGTLEFGMQTQGMLFWNMPIGFLKSSYSVISICCLLNIAYMSWNEKDAIINSTLSCIIFGFLLVYPGLIQLFLYKRSSEMKRKAFQNKYIAAYEGLIIEDQKFILQPIFFFYRRILLPMFVILFPSNLTTQFFALEITGLATIMMIGYTIPFKSPSRNKAEMLEEVAIIILMYHMLCFSDWQPDMKTR